MSEKTKVAIVGSGNIDTELAAPWCAGPATRVRASDATWAILQPTGDPTCQQLVANKMAVMASDAEHKRRTSSA